MPLVIVRPSPERVSSVNRKMDELGYDLSEVLVVEGEDVVYLCGAGRIRIGKTNRWLPSRGAFYDNHTGRGETAVQAAVAAIRRNKNK